jgi:integrase
MTVYFDEERARWIYDFERGGKRYKQNAVDADGRPVTSRRAAIEAEGVAKRAAEIAPKLPSAKHFTLAQAMEMKRETWKRQADAHNTKRYVAEILEHFGAATPVSAIGNAEVDAYIAASLAKKTRVYTGGPAHREATHLRQTMKEGSHTRSPRTVNLYLNVLRQALKACLDVRDPLTSEPALKAMPRIPKLSIPKRRARPVPETVLSAIIARVPEHVVEAIRLTLFFGFRKGEVFGLQIRHVDFDAGGIWLTCDEVKDAEDVFMPGAPVAMDELRRLVVRAKERGAKHLITWRPSEKSEWRALKGVKSAWRTAMDEVEKEHGKRWRWHDIRAAYITHIAVTAGPAAAQALARHSEYATTQMYVDVADQVRRDGANKAAERPALKIVGKSPTIDIPPKTPAKRGKAVSP